MDDKSIFSTLSLCQKAGFIVSGEASCEKALKSNDAKLVIVSEDASLNTKTKFLNKCHYYKTDCFVFGSNFEINKALGKQNKMTLAVTNENFALKIKKYIDDNES